MQTFALRLLIASLFGGVCLSSRAQVYAIGASGGPMVIVRVDEHTWLVGSSPNAYGFLQYRCRSGENAPWVSLL
jgi:hypothetical protein